MHRTSAWPLLFSSFVLILVSLACRAATRLIIPDTPTPTSPAATPGGYCPDETTAILKAATTDTYTSGTFPNVDTGDQVDILLVTYAVNGDQISHPVLETVPAKLARYQQDVGQQEQAWTLFTTLIPADRRVFVHQYQVITDGPSEILAAVEQTYDDPNSWILEIDIADIPNTKNLVFTLLHEFGHLLTLNASQVPPDLQVFNHPDSDRIFNREVAACPSYFPGEGCSTETSYINTYFDRFWPNLYDEWQQIDAIQNDDHRQNRLDDFYRKYRDQFVDDYAVTNPSEDIAETWAFFVLGDKPTGNSIRDQKVLFFYDYPELVLLRNRILKNLCAANP